MPPTVRNRRGDASLNGGKEVLSLLLEREKKTAPHDPFSRKKKKKKEIPRICSLPTISLYQREKETHDEVKISKKKNERDEV